MSDLKVNFSALSTAAADIGSTAPNLSACSASGPLRSAMASCLANSRGSCSTHRRAVAVGSMVTA